MGKTRLVVFSLDSMVREDVEYLKTLPSFRQYFADDYAEVETIRTVYPSITYPVHASIVSGCYPEKTGVTNNSPFHTTQGEAPWCWDHKYLKAPDIFTAAKKAGYRTAAVGWPVTGNHPDIDCLIDEYWPQKGESLMDAFRSMGSDERMLSIIEKNASILDGTYVLGGRKNVIVQPNLDWFLVSSAADILENDLCDVLFLHGAYMDAIRHRRGVFNDMVSEGVRICDEEIGTLMRAIERGGHADETNVVLLSDHGQKDIVRALNVNVLFRDKGWIDVDAKGNVVSWKVYSLSNACSALIYVKDRKDEEEVASYLRTLADEGIYGFTKVYDRENLQSFHLSGDFSFVLESDGYTSLVNGVERPLVQNLDNTDYRYGRATHGYLPDKGPQPFFLGKGPAFRKGARLKRRPIVDEGPTFARILCVELPEAQGRVMEQLLV